ncbi:hypothetical protein [Megasphaera sp.]|uniref:hypothetical protein n=1 Tax=Megasphaera sp. TaxID=2023260 RepID=UPI004024EA05
MAAKSKYNYIEDNISQNYAPRQYSAPFTTQALPQLNFAQYAFQDPRFALGMLLGNAVGANILNRKQKEADQMLFRQDNPVSMPDNVPLYDTSSTPALADGKTAAVGNAYSGFGANPAQVSDNFLANLQGVNGRLNYNTDTGAINYQTPTFLPSMYAANNLGNYYPTATDADGNMIGNISFADYLNNQSKAGQGQGLFDFNALQKMAADDAAKAAAKNPQATVAQSMGVLPTANVDVPSKSNSYIPAITGRLGNPINGSLSMSGFNLNNNDPNSKFYTWNLKSGGDVADASPATIPSAQTSVPGMIAPGNVDTSNGLPKVRVTEIDGKHYILPATGADGKTLDENQTAYNFYETGNTFGVFDNQKDAKKYADQINKDAGDKPVPAVHAMEAQPTDEAPIKDVQPIQPVDNQPIKPIDNQPIKEEPAPIQSVEGPIQPVDATTQANTQPTAQANAQATTQTPQANVTITPGQQANVPQTTAAQADTGIFPNDPQKLMDRLFPGETQIDNPHYKELLDQYNKETDPVKKQSLMDKLNNTPAYILRSDNPYYMATKTLYDNEKDANKKKEWQAALDNLPRYNIRPFDQVEQSLETDMSGGHPKHIDAQKNESDFVHWAIQHDMPIDVVNSTLERYRPVWQAEEQQYNDYQTGALYPLYYQAAMNGQYDTAATIAQSMAQYNPQMSAQMLATLPNGLNYYATADAKNRAATAQQYKQANMGLQNKYTLGQIVTRGKIEDNQLDKRLKHDTWKTNVTITEKARENDNNNRTKIITSKYGPNGSSKGGSGGGSGDVKFSEAKGVIELHNKWVNDHKGDDDYQESNSPYYNAYQDAVKTINDHFGEGMLDPDDSQKGYSNAWHNATALLEQNEKMGNKYSMFEMEDIIKQKCGDWANHINQILADGGGKISFATYGLYPDYE